VALLLLFLQSQDSSVDIVMGYGPDSWGSIPGMGKRFTLLHIVQTGSRAHPAPYPMDTGGLFPREYSSWGVKLTTDLHPFPRLRMVELYLHCPTRLHSLVLN
jgi:hypothetical protein